MKFSLAAKFNLVFLVIFVVGFAAAWAVANVLLKQNAREETLRNARILMESALAARGYTSKQIVPLLKTQLDEKFLPQSIPSYSATEHLSSLLKNYPDFTYKEATLNPTNPRDRAVEWEADVVNTLRSSPATQEYVGERLTATGPSLYIAYPLRITDTDCLRCHSVPAAAPKTMLDIYGSTGGFGWKHNEIVGAQMVSVPMTVPLARANGMLRTFLLSMLGVFVFLFVSLNVMVDRFVTRRITRMSALADEISMGKFDVAEFDASGSDELATLAQSFKRMRTSLNSAMKMLDD
ncbi:MAG: DUF3365 domain-containing protein [Aeromicrobium sp.]|nr:DUF3365 domain-containing protein [Burkholderiales bacterium]